MNLTKLIFFLTINSRGVPKFRPSERITPMKYNFTKAEQETHITWDAVDNLAHIYTARPSMIRKLDKLVKAYPNEYKCVWTDSLYDAKKYTVPARYIRFGKPASEKKKAAARKNGERAQYSL